MDVDLNAYQWLGFRLEREDDSGEIILTVTGDGDESVRVNAGDSPEDAEQIRDSLRSLLADAEDLVKDWETRPDFESDAFVADGRDGYSVSLEGSHIGTYPSRDIATYELARAMADGGVSPNCWYQNERGNTDSIGEEISKYLGEDDKLLPLPGAEFEPGDVIRHADRNRCDWPMAVDRDYGELGIWAHTSGDPSITELIEDRDGWHSVEDDEDDEDDQS